MASAFKTASANEVGTSLTTVYTCPSSTTTTIIGLYLCNVAGADINATAQFLDSSTSNHISLVHSIEIPAGSTLAPIGGDAKVRGFRRGRRVGSDRRRVPRVVHGSRHERS